MTNKDILREYKVAAVGDGKKVKNGRKTKQDAKIVFVEKKYKNPLMVSFLKATGRFIPPEIDGEKTDIQEIPKLKPLRTKERPVIGGCSGMINGWTACTIGAIVFKGEKPYILSNEHCVDRWFDLEQVGEKILQPSPFDGGTVEDAISTLVNTEHRMVLDGKTHNLFDSSVQPLDEGIPYRELYQKQIGEINNVIATVRAGDRVQKRGRTTGLTEGEVIATNVVASVRYGLAGNKIGMFENQIFIRNKNWDFVNGGDSGSICLNMNKDIVGHLYAGSGGDNGVGVVAPMKAIMETLGFTFTPQEEEEAEKFNYVAAGRENAWYVKCPIGKTRTEVGLNLRTSPRVLPSTFIRTLPVGTNIEVLEDLGNMMGYRWVKIKAL